MITFGKNIGLFAATALMLGVGGVSLLQVVHDAALRHVRYHDHVVDAHHHALLAVALREGGGSALPAPALRGHVPRRRDCD